MNNKRQRNRLFAILMLVMAWLIPQWTWAQTASQPTVGDGTADSPYEIATAAELAWFRDHVNEGNHNACAKLADNIDLSDFCHAADASNNIEGLSWEPIGNETHQYWGTFDGNGKTVSNLYINASQSYMGLFGIIIECTVKNLIFENANVTSAASHTGILVGYTGADCSLQNVRTSATCQANGAEKTGGIAGCFDGDANSCENRATVRGTEEVGGLFGRYSRTGNYMTACANYGTVAATGPFAGGLAGYFSGGTIKDCANYGNVEGSYYIGGMAGFADQGKIQNVFCHGNVTANIDEEGGLAFGRSYNGSTEGMVAYYSGATLTIKGQKQETRAFGSDSNLAEDNAAGYTKEQIASGEVAWLLNGSASAPAEGETLYWYQKLGDNADAYPVLVSTGANTVYKAPLTSCDGATSIGEYANNPEGDKLSHHYQMAETPAEGTTNLYGEICSVCQYANDEAKYIKDFCGIEGNDIKLTVESDGSYTAAEPIDINDATTYDSPVDFTAPTLNYTRSYLGGDQWQAVYVPFEADATDWTDNGITVASINNFHEYEKEDGSGYETVLEVKKATSGEFEANTPYVVRTSGSGSESKTITISEAKLHKAASETYYCMSMTRRYDFTGIYTPQSGLGRDDISAVYALDKQGRMAPLRPATTLGAQRWYLTVSNRNGSSLPQESVARTIRIDMIGEGETTGIKDIQVITGNGTAHTGIYDLQGRKLNNEPTHSIYIKNGKKHVK